MLQLEAMDSIFPTYNELEIFNAYFWFSLAVWTEKISYFSATKKINTRAYQCIKVHKINEEKGTLSLFVFIENTNRGSLIQMRTP
jgi:hypothetical protein